MDYLYRLNPPTTVEGILDGTGITVNTVLLAPDSIVSIVSATLSVEDEDSLDQYMSDMGYTRI